MARGCLGFLFPTPPPPEVPAVPDQLVELSVLWRAFQLEPEGASERYVGQVVETWGQVHDIEDGVVFVWPDGAGDGWPKTCAAFLPPFDGEPGDPVRIRGVCQGLDEEVLVFRPCVLVDDTPADDELRFRRAGGHLVHHEGAHWLVGGWDPQIDGPRLEVELLERDGTIASGPQLPGERDPAAVVAVAGRIVAVGGRERPGSSVGRVDQLVEGEWVEGPDLPHPWRDGGAAALGTDVLVAGGIGTDQLFGPDDWRRECWRLRETWEARARLPQPRRGGRLLALPDGRLCWIGGKTPEGAATDALVYDPRADAWSIVECTTLGVGSRGAAVLTDGRVLLAGGHVTRAGRHLSGGSLEPDVHTVVGACHLWDPSTGQATALPELPVARRDATVLALDASRALVIGGEVGTDDPHVFEPADAVALVDAGVHTIVARAPLAQARAGASVVRVGGEVWVVGGTGPGGDALRSVERLPIDTLTLRPSELPTIASG